MKKSKKTITHLLHLGEQTSALVLAYKERRGFKHLATALQVLVRMGARRATHLRTYRVSDKGRKTQERYVRRLAHRNRIAVAIRRAS
jgi:hypothetical protein